MKKIMLTFLVLVAISCKDDEASLSVEELLMKPTNGWIQTSVIVTIPGSTTKVDVFSDPAFATQYPDCLKDNAIVFRAAGIYSIESTVKCSTSEPSTVETGTWSLSSDQKTITFTPLVGTARTASILNISESEFKADITLNFGSTAITASVTMKPK